MARALGHAVALGLLLGMHPCVARVDTSGWVGAEYTPAAAPGNSLWWHWFDDYEASVERELGMARRWLGITAVRIFLHEMVYFDDPARLGRNMDRFLAIAARHNVSAGFVFFDDCWNRRGASLEKPCTPVKGRHNGCWMASPQDVDRTSIERFRPYIVDIVQRYRHDPRVLWWEVINEPTSPWSTQLREAGYHWAKSVEPMQPVLSLWDDNNATDIVDHHDYGTNFKSGVRPSRWRNAIYENPAKGAFVTEAGSRWFQPPFSADNGSPLTVINFLEALRRNESVPYVPGVMICWELMVGNSNTRWHWQTRDGAAEPAIPWDAWLFPDGTPVSHTEAAALRRYVTGRDEFLAFDAFLPREVADGDHVLSLPAGEEWHADVKGGVVGDALVEVSFWPEQPNGTFTLAVRSRNRTEPSTSFTSCTASQTVMEGTDINGAANYTNFELGVAPLGTCQRACCDSAICAAWVVRELAEHEADRNCTGPGRCCWLKAATSGAVHRPGCTSSFVSRDPQPVRPRSFDGYFVVVDGSQLTVSRREGSRQLQLSSFDLGTLENGVVARAWNMLRVLVRGNSIDVWFNPMYPETGFEGTAADAQKLPWSVPPRIAVRDPSAGGPLADGGVAIAADRFGARVDYISVLPPLVSAPPLQVVV